MTRILRIVADLQAAAEDGSRGADVIWPQALLVERAMGAEASESARRLLAARLSPRLARRLGPAGIASALAAERRMGRIAVVPPAWRLRVLAADVLRILLRRKAPAALLPMEAGDARWLDPEDFGLRERLVRSGLAAGDRIIAEVSTLRQIEALTDLTVSRRDWRSVTCEVRLLQPLSRLRREDDVALSVWLAALDLAFDAPPHIVD